MPKKIVKGFTLIELLVVVAIIGILAAVGVVAYNGYTGAAKKKTTEANHKIIAKYIQNEWMKCELGEQSIMPLNGTNQISCNTNIWDPWLAFASIKVLNTKMKNAHTNGVAIINNTFYKCYESGKYAAEGQGQHGVTQGSAKIYVHSCIESTGTPITTVINLQ